MLQGWKLLGSAYRTVISTASRVNDGTGNRTRRAGNRTQQNVRRNAIVLSTVTLACLSLTLGCGNSYRPVVSAINPVGPAGQATKYAYAIANPGSSSSGLLTVIDFAGDTVLATPTILSNPIYFAVNSGGSDGYAINGAGSFNYIPALQNTAQLLSNKVIQSTLPASANPVTVSVATLSGQSATVFVPETGRSRVAVLDSTGSLQQEVAVPANPAYVVAADGAARAYVIAQGSGTGNGSVAALEAGTYSVSSTITVGANPVYGVMTADDRRAIILNKGSVTVSVLNVVNNALDSTTPVIPANGTLGVNPVWADLSPRTNQLVVLNAGDGVNPGSLSIINIPLCNATAQATNPTCVAGNPVDATDFGTVTSTVPVGVNPTMVSVLQDGSRAYVVNAGNAASGTEGSVSVVNLTSGRVTATIPAVSSVAATQAVNSTPAAVYGHPNTIIATTGSPTGKVYITSADNRYLTVLETDTDTVLTHINLQGLGVRVLISTQ